jgi:hypothetical protein
MPGFRKKSRSNRSRRRNVKKRQSRRNRTNGGRRYRQRAGATVAAAGSPAELNASFETEVKTISDELKSKDPADKKPLKEKVNDIIAAINTQIGNDAVTPHKNAVDIASFRDNLKTAVVAVKQAEDNKNPASELESTNSDEDDLLKKFVTALQDATYDENSGNFEIVINEVEGAATKLAAAAGASVVKPTPSVVASSPVTATTATVESYEVYILTQDGKRHLASNGDKPGEVKIKEI